MMAFINQDVYVCDASLIQVFACNVGLRVFPLSIEVEIYYA